MESAILKWCKNLLRLLNLWFDASVAGRAFNRVSAVLGNAFSHSLTGRFFQPRQSSMFQESLFCRLLLLPVTLCRCCAEKVGGLWESVTASSGFCWLLANWHSISSRAYGMTLLVFTVTYALLRCLLSFPTPLQWCLIGALLVLSLLMIAVNRSLKALFKGSTLLTAFGGLFCEMKRDTDSKLFFKDPDFLFSRPVLVCLIGITAGIAAALMPLPSFLLLAGGLAYFCLTMHYTVFGVYTVIIAAPLLPTMVLTACCLLCVLSFLLRLATCRQMKLRPVPLGGYIAVFMLTLCISTLLSLTFVKSLQILLIYIAFVLFYFVAYQTLDTKKKWRGALVSLVTVSVLVALYGIFQNFAGMAGAASWVDSSMFSQISVRVYSTFDNPNVLGEYLVIMIPVTLAVLWQSKSDGQRFVYTAAFLLLAACMVFTWSRGAWLGVLLAAGLFLLIADKRWALLAVFGVLLLPMLLATDSAIASRILSIGNTQDSSTAYRVSIWRASLNMIQDFGLSGIGLGSEAFSMIYPKYALAGANFALHSHNLFLQMIAEAGIAGIVSFLAMILAFVRQCLSAGVYQLRRSSTGAACIALTCGVLGYLFQGLTDNVWYNYKMVLIFWIVLALAGSAAAPDFNGGERT